MQGKIVRRFRVSVLGVGVLALALAGCGPTSDADRIAAEACDILERAIDGDFEAFAELEDLDRQVDEAGLSDADMEDALERECGDLLDEAPGL